MPTAPEGGGAAASRTRRAVDWAFRSRATGRITLAQAPNPPLWIFLGLAAAGWLLDPPGAAGVALRVAASLSLTWWALDEVLRGVNPWRRFLGAVVLVGLALAWT